MKTRFRPKCSKLNNSYLIETRNTTGVVLQQTKELSTVSIDVCNVVMNT